MSKSTTFSLLLALLLVYNPNFVKENKIRTSAGEYLKQPAFIYQVFRCSPVIHSFRLMDACDYILCLPNSEWLGFLFWLPLLCNCLLCWVMGIMLLYPFVFSFGVLCILYGPFFLS